MSAAGNVWHGLQGRLKRLAKAQASYIFTILIKITAAVASFGVTFLIAGRFGAETVGIYALFTQTLVTFSMFVVFGNEHHVVRAVATNMALGQPERARVLVRRGARSVIGVGLLFAAGFASAGMFPVDAVLPRDLMWLAAIGVLGNAVIIYGAGVIRGVHRTMTSQLLLSCVPAVMLLLAAAAYLVPMPEPAQALPAAFTAATLLTAGVTGALVWRLVSRWPRMAEPFVREPGDGQVMFGLISSLNYASIWTLLVLVGWLFDTAQVGVFRVCVQFSTLIMMVIQTYHGVISPQFARLNALGDYAAIRRMLIQSQIVQGALCGAPVLVVLVFAEQLLGIMGEEFVVGAGVLRMLALSALIASLCGAGGPLLIMSGKERTSLALALAGFVAAVLFLLVSAEWIGLEAAGFAVVVSNFIRFVGSWFYAERWLNKRMAAQAT